MPKMQITIELFIENPFFRHLKCIIWDDFRAFGMRDLV
ncbi:hypothetical protein DBT_0490 [Dissulfuribacter thermophilus]|uniref:Uncharacterized protein n=1 Tax=Dissulfuribacter thermophilus TaxID=1156395 RepID=A0A1B9F7U8_9BACT|nr:hypothetical protein DBT_0490 [Dissulfuribacter thermophilus]